METVSELLERIVDPGSFAPAPDGLSTSDPLSYPDYASLLDKARGASGVDESVVTGPAAIGGIEVEVGLFSFAFMGGSMGEVAGERLARGLERAAEREVPFVLRTGTGGARMQEGMRSLIQMPKVVAARLTLADARQPLLAVLAHPTTGGVLASIAAAADVTVAEADATIGFAGPRVAERFTGRALSDNSHTAGSAFAQGLVDELVPASDVHAYLAGALKLLRGAVAKEPVIEPTGTGVSAGSGDEPWNIVEAARAPDRPSGEQLIRDACDELVELRGDRQGVDDPALFAALARIAGRRVLILALDPAHFPGPGAFRKAKRCLGVAERLGFPVATVVDSRGADPSEDSEAGGIAWEISSLFEAMLRAEVPILSVVTGEGGSGGALAFATGDLLVAYADSIFSVIGPEGAAEILWRDGDKAPQAAALLKLTAHDLARLGIADAVTDATLGPESLRDLVAYHLDRLTEGRAGDRDWSRARRTRWRNLSGH